MTKLTAAHSEMAHSKAVSQLADSDTLWERHQDPWISGLIEDWTAQGLQRIAAIRAAIMAKLHQVHPQHGQLAKAAPPWHKWDTEEMARAQFALESKARADYTLDDWLALIDLLIQTYWPAGVIQSEADYLTIRSYFAGHGRGVVREGDTYAVHCCKHRCHPGALAQGSRKVFANGKGLGRIGDAVNCGSVSAMGSSNVFAG